MYCTMFYMFCSCCPIFHCLQSVVNWQHGGRTASVAPASSRPPSQLQSHNVYRQQSVHYQTPKRKTTSLKAPNELILLKISGKNYTTAGEIKES